MVMEAIKLGAFVSEIIRVINSNFSEVDLNKANISDIPVKLSALENDSGYQTAEQVAAAVSALVNAAPETLDTLKELAEALGNDPNFAATIMAQLGGKVDAEPGKGLSENDLTDALLEKLNSLTNYTLPVANTELGGVKNGGSVTINADGTMDAPSGGAGTAEVARVSFTADDSRWSGPVEGVYTFTAETSGKHPLSVWRQESGESGISMCNVRVSGLNVLVDSYDKFAGYLLLI